MKQPNLKSLKKNESKTNRIKSKMNKDNKIKITINIDESSIKALKKKSGRSGVPYQRLLNEYLKEAIDEKAERDNRLKKLEREMEKLKAKIA